MFTVSSSFIASFKTGDNINHNLKILGVLYHLYDQATSHEKRLLCKPITITLVSIIEAVLHDFHIRIKNYTSEGVINLADSIASYIQRKKIDELEKYITSAQRHNLFDATSSTFYDRLHDLRKLRNRIHIQNTKNHFEPDERTAFTESRKKVAEKVLERTVKIMAVKYPRDLGASYVNDFKFPWHEHFPATAPAPNFETCPHCGNADPDFEFDILMQCMNCGQLY